MEMRPRPLPFREKLGQGGHDPATGGGERVPGASDEPLTLSRVVDRPRAGRRARRAERPSSQAARVASTWEANASWIS